MNQRYNTYLLTNMECTCMSGQHVLAHGTHLTRLDMIMTKVSNKKVWVTISHTLLMYMS